MKLEEGMYVRTNKGKIAKIINKEDISGSLHKENLVWVLDDFSVLALNSQKVIKTSHNPIDLIEVGDYVNGYKVTKINIKAPITNNKAIECGINSSGSSITYVYDNKDIKSIVTKEQFSQTEYKVGE